jgi:hypothetical protein
MKFLSLAALLVLAACSNDQPVVTSTRHVAVVPQEHMFECNIIETFPEPTTLTDLQVARLILQLYENNRVCRNSINVLRTFLDSAKRSLEADRTK